MNILLFILFALYMCWTALIGLIVLYGLATGKRMSWNTDARNIWLGCTAAVLIYFWFN